MCVSCDERVGSLGTAGSWSSAIMMTTKSSRDSTDEADGDDEREWSYRRVLSVQSHTVHGYVGNKAAVFPLQLNGFDVDFINAVQFSNHTGYGSWTGSKLDGDQLKVLMDGLDENSLLGYSHLLTGYAGSASFLRAIVQCAKRLKENAPRLQYFCDPVMGDNGKLYVPQELVKIYAAEVVPLADVLLPNQFECELLTGISISSEADAIRACTMLHEKGPQIVVVTSLSLEKDGKRRSDYITMMLSWMNPEAITAEDEEGSLSSDGSGRRQVFKLHIPRIEGYYTGTGDLTSALMLASLSRYANRPEKALEIVAASVRAVLQRTATFSERLKSSDPKNGRRRRVSRLAPPELRLIQSQSDLVNPTVEFRAVRCDYA
eukprot:g10.t1